jgi:hypothetical protein
MSNKNIKFFEIEYNYKDNSTAEKMTAIVTDAEYSKKVFMDIDDEIFHYDMDEQYLKILVELGSSTFNDFIVYSYKEIKSVLEDTKKERMYTEIEMRLAFTMGSLHQVTGASSIEEVLEKLNKTI